MLRKGQSSIILQQAGGNEVLMKKRVSLSITFIFMGVFSSFFLLLSGCGEESIKSKEKEILTLAVLYEDPELSRWVTRFNSDNSEVEIEIQNYGEAGTDVIDAMNRIRMEIVSGKGPDLIDFGLLYSPRDVSGGILENLYTYMQEDISFQKQDYFYNIIDSFGVGESLYVMVPSFRITSFATIDEELIGLDNWNVQTMINCYEGRPQGMSLFPGETKVAVFGMICTGSMENYVDWDKGTCRFDSDSFKSLLMFANQFPLKLNLAEDVSIKDMFSEGKSLLFPAYISDVYEIRKIKMLLGENSFFVGYPMDEGSGNISVINNIAIGIGKNCKNKDAAWHFIKSLLSNDFQNSVTNGLPVSRSSLQLLFDDAMKETYLNNKEKKIKAEILFEGEDSVPIYSIASNDAELLTSIIEKVEYNSAIDRNLYNIVLEEADSLFHEKGTIDSVSDIIQNRANVYMKENR